MITSQEKDIFDKADMLPADVKIQLIDKLLASLNPTTDNIQESWIKEAKKRKNEVETSKVDLVDGESIFSEIIHKYKNNEV